jgi:hypothetical protein
MKRQYLFPAKCQKIGWVLMILAAVYFIINAILQNLYSIDIDFDIKMPALFGLFPFDKGGERWFTIANTNISLTISPVVFILGGLLVGFSKEKQEDELIVALRERSLVWAMIVGYFVLIFLYLFIYGYAFLYVMRFIVDLFLILYIIKFKIELYRLKRQYKDEK